METSSQVISVAPASPGEQGVSFSAPLTVTCSDVSVVVNRLNDSGIMQVRGQNVSVPFCNA